jgi:uncharacterized protein with von Willebrand factor type A (vWA) domain
MSDKGPLLATAAISGIVGILGATIAAFATAHVADMENQQKSIEYVLKRRHERQEAYQAAIDLLNDFHWRIAYDPHFDVVRDFNLPFLHASGRMRVYGSPESIAAVDEVMEALTKLNEGKDKKEREAANAALIRGEDHLTAAARADVGPRQEDGLRDVPFQRGAGPRT